MSLATFRQGLRTGVEPRVRSAPRRSRFGRVAAVTGITLILLLVAATYFIDEPLRRRTERTLNEKLVGYTATVPGLSLHWYGLSLTLRDLTVRQASHPNPPVLVISNLDASVHWRALLHLRLVADFELNEPRLHINRPQLQAEAADKTKVSDKGWQQALESIYPLKINHFEIHDGSLTYIDTDPKRPLEVKQLEVLITNIRNISSPNDRHPSPLHMTATVFDKGHLEVDGHANLLAVPQPTTRAKIELKGVPLDKLQPVSQHANLHVSGGVLSASGDIDYAAERQDARLRQAQIDGVTIDYVHSSATAAAEARRMDQVEESANQLAAQPQTLVVIDALRLRKAALGYVDQTVDPSYRVFLSDADIDILNLSNHADAGPAGLIARGAFMGSGPSRLDVGFLPRSRTPEINLAMQIEGTEMRRMNDLFRAHANFDVTEGKFSFYSQLQIANGQINGYVKPLFEDVKIYDRRQDSSKPLFQQIYEGLVGGVAGLLENRQSRVATQADLRGEAQSPNLSTLQVIGNLIRNAFFKAILPGLDEAIRGIKNKPEAAESK